MSSQSKIMVYENVMFYTHYRGKLDETADNDHHDLEASIYKEDSNCVTAGKPLTQFDLFVSTIVRVQSSQIDRIFEKKVKANAELLEPRCGKYKPHKFVVQVDNIRGVTERKNLSMQGDWLKKVKRICF